MAANTFDSEVFLKKLYGLTLKLLIPLTAKESYPIIGRAAMKLLGADYSSIFVANGKGFERAWDSSTLMFRVTTDKRGYAARAVTTKTPIVISVSKLVKLHPDIVDWGLKSVIFIPIFYKKIKMGYIALDLTREIALSKKGRDSLKLFGSLAALALRKAQLHDELAESLSTRDLFISLASHELRTPVTTINLYADLIKKMVASGKLPDKKWTNIIAWETTRLIMMINELLQLDTIKAGKLEYHWKTCDIGEILKRAVLDFKATHRGRMLIVKNSIKKGGMVFADFDKLLQALLNLLGNAAKFSPNKTKIYLEAKFEAPYFVISVRDRGTGILENDLPKVFEGFYKGGFKTKPGLGIGLYLTKSIIEIHRGKINIESQKDQGTKVTIKILRTDTAAS